VPGSHIWAKGRKAKPEEVAYAEADMGSGIFWLGSTIHGGGANICEVGEVSLFSVFSRRLSLTLEPITLHECYEMFCQCRMQILEVKAFRLSGSPEKYY